MAHLELPMLHVTPGLECMDRPHNPEHSDDEEHHRTHATLMGEIAEPKANDGHEKIHTPRPRRRSRRLSLVGVSERSCTLGVVLGPAFAYPHTPNAPRPRSRPATHMAHMHQLHTRMDART